MSSAHLPVLEVTDLSKKFCRDPHLSLRYFIDDIGREILGRNPSPHLRSAEFWALREISFSLHQGEVLGVVGHNGAGKSTLINLIAGLIRPTSGRVLLRSNRIALMDHRGGLNSSLTGRENIHNQLSLHGCPSELVPSKEASVIEFAEIGSFIDTAVGTYSLGMRQRLAFSIYTQLEPDLFIVDEALNGGDLRFRQKFASFLKDYIGKGGSILLCSHELHAIQMLCPRSILLDHGNLISCGGTSEIIDLYHRMQGHQLSGDALTAAPTDTQDGLSEEEVSISSVSAKSRDDVPILPGGAVCFEIMCHSKKHRDGILFAVEIGNEFMSSLSTMMAGLPPDTLSLKAGENRIRCRIESLPLASGTYQVRSYITEKNKSVPLATFGVENPPLLFSVGKTADPRSNMTAYRKNLLHLEPEWIVDDVPRSGC